MTTPRFTTPLPAFDPRSIPMIGVDTHLSGVPAQALTPQALRQRVDPARGPARQRVLAAQPVVHREGEVALAGAEVEHAHRALARGQRRTRVGMREHLDELVDLPPLACHRGHQAAAFVGHTERGEEGPGDVDEAVLLSDRIVMMTNGPSARIGEVLDVPIARPRDRIALLLDPGSPWLELATLAGYGLDTPDEAKTVPGGGVIGGIGFVAGIRCVVAASDSGIDAGAMQAGGLEKALRIQEVALENRLPYVQLVESAGANLLKYRVEGFVRGGSLFRNLARMSAAGLPVVERR